VKPIREVCWNVVEGILALAMLVLFWWLLLLMALFIRTASDGPVIVTDHWLAPDGRTVRACRLRTTGRGLPTFQTLARLIRRYSLDELPSLWNVVRGEAKLKDLTLFGPR
jgi:lipopolysaccharide/colanic/teichoic acid biosynthesis glycosyltransferase